MGFLVIHFIDSGLERAATSSNSSILNFSSFMRSRSVSGTVHGHRRKAVNQSCSVPRQNPPCQHSLDKFSTLINDQGEKEAGCRVRLLWRNIALLTERYD